MHSLAPRARMERPSLARRVHIGTRWRGGLVPLAGLIPIICVLRASAVNYRIDPTPAAVERGVAPTACDDLGV